MDIESYEEWLSKRGYDTAHFVNGVDVRKNPEYLKKLYEKQVLKIKEKDPNIIHTNPYKKGTYDYWFYEWIRDRGYNTATIVNGVNVKEHPEYLRKLYEKYKEKQAEEARKKGLLRTGTAEVEFLTGKTTYKTEVKEGDVWVDSSGKEVDVKPGDMITTKIEQKIPKFALPNRKIYYADENGNRKMVDLSPHLNQYYVKGYIKKVPFLSEDVNLVLSESPVYKSQFAPHSTYVPELDPLGSPIPSSPPLAYTISNLAGDITYKALDLSGWEGNSKFFASKEQIRERTRTSTYYFVEGVNDAFKDVALSSSLFLLTNPAYISAKVVSHYSGLPEIHSPYALYNKHIEPLIVDDAYAPQLTGDTQIYASLGYIAGQMVTSEAIGYGIGKLVEYNYKPTKVDLYQRSYKIDGIERSYTIADVQTKGAGKITVTSQQEVMKHSMIDGYQVTNIKSFTTDNPTFAYSSEIKITFGEKWDMPSKIMGVPIYKDSGIPLSHIYATSGYEGVSIQLQKGNEILSHSFTPDIWGRAIQTDTQLYTTSFGKSVIGTGYIYSENGRIPITIRSIDVGDIAPKVDSMLEWKYKGDLWGTRKTGYAMRNFPAPEIIDTNIPDDLAHYDKVISNLKADLLTRERFGPFTKDISYGGDRELIRELTKLRTKSQVMVTTEAVDYVTQLGRYKGSEMTTKVGAVGLTSVLTLPKTSEVVALPSFSEERKISTRKIQKSVQISIPKIDFSTKKITVSKLKSGSLPVIVNEKVSKLHISNINDNVKINDSIDNIKIGQEVVPKLASFQEIKTSSMSEYSFVNSFNLIPNIPTFDFNIDFQLPSFDFPTFSSFSQSINESYSYPSARFYFYMPDLTALEFNEIGIPKIPFGVFSGLESRPILKDF